MIKKKNQFRLNLFFIDRKIFYDFIKFIVKLNEKLFYGFIFLFLMQRLFILMEGEIEFDRNKFCSWFVWNIESEIIKKKCCSIYFILNYLY